MMSFQTGATGFFTAIGNTQAIPYISSVPPRLKTRRSSHFHHLILYNNDSSIMVNAGTIVLVTYKVALFSVQKLFQELRIVGLRTVVRVAALLLGCEVFACIHRNTK